MWWFYYNLFWLFVNLGYAALLNTPPQSHIPGNQVFDISAEFCISHSFHMFYNCWVLFFSDVDFVLISFAGLGYPGPIRVQLPKKPSRLSG